MPKEIKNTRKNPKPNSSLVIIIIILALILLIVVFYLIFSKPALPPIDDNNNGNQIPPGATLCPAETGEFCIELYQPVCGYFDPKKIQCIKYPCAQTFSNSCFACSNENVLYYTDGECPA